MRGPVSTLALLLAAAGLGSACSLVVSTAGLAGGSDVDGGGGGPQNPAPSGGPTGPGVVLPEAGSMPGATVDMDASSGTVADAAPGGSSLPEGGDSSPESGPPSGTPDAGGINPGPADSGGPAPDVAAPPPTACGLGLARVFVTSSMYDGDFGGVAGADADCAASATAQDIGGEWRAWMSDSSTPAVAHIYASTGGYVLLDGTVVASSFAALLSGSLAHAIDLTELNAPPPDGYTEVWTGIDVTGEMANGGYCSYYSGGDWSSDSSEASTPLVGHLDASDSTWTAAYLQLCNRTDVRLYCFEACD
jgi:hypothetical protein